MIAYGALWPNLLAVAVMPAATAAVLTLAGHATASTLGRTEAGGLAAVALPVLGLAHPNAVFGLGVVAVWPAAWALAGFVRRHVRTAQWHLAVVVAVAAAGAIAAAVWVMVDSPLLAGTRSYTWQPTKTWQEAVIGLLTNSAEDSLAGWMISALVVVGVVVALKNARTSWLVAAHAAVGCLYVVAASTGSSPWTGAWYNDAPRLAAMLPLTATPLAVLGALALASALRRAAVVFPHLFRHRVPRLALVTLGLLALVSVSGGLNQRPHTDYLAAAYQSPHEELLAPGQTEFLLRAGQMLPPDAVVAQNPFTGNALLYALTDRRVLFPHLQGVWTPAQRIIAERLPDAATDPRVCAALAETGVGYALTAPATFWTWNVLAPTFPGLDDLGSAPGFELIADDGENRLYQITACGPIPGSAS